MHWTAGAAGFELDMFDIKKFVYIDFPIINICWFSYTGMYTDHTVFNHSVQNIWYFVLKMDYSIYISYIFCPSSAYISAFLQKFRVKPNLS